MSDDLIGLHLAHLAAGGVPTSTIQSRRELLTRLNRDLPYGLAFAATEHIEAWLANHTSQGRAQNTLAIYGYHVRSFYSWACESGYLDGNPVTTIRWAKSRRGLPQPITEDELARVLTVAEPLRTAVILAAFAGLRRAEIAAARREHITEHIIVVPRGKGGAAGTVPTHGYVWNHVRERPTGLLVLDRYGKPVTPTWLGQRARYAFDALGLPGVRLHRLRHRYGTLIQQLYGDLRVTQECLRHVSVNSTQGYTLVTGERRAAAVSNLPVPREPGLDVGQPGPATNDARATPAAR
jgi:integrase